MIKQQDDQFSYVIMFVFELKLSFSNLMNLIKFY